MRFSVSVNVMVECSHSADGYEYKPLPTIQIEAPTLGDAEARMDCIMGHLPAGTTYTLVEI